MKNTAVLIAFLCLLASAAEAQTPSSASPPPSPAATSSPAASTTAAKPDVSIPIDAAKSWTVGFTVLTAEGLSTENAYLAYSLPLLLKNEVGAIDTHTLAPDEKDLVRGAVVNREIVAAESAIAKVRAERDALAFATPPATETARQGVEDRVAAAIARRDFLQSLDLSQVEVADEKPVSNKEGTEVGKLLDPPSVPPDVYCVREGIDLLVGGSLREVQGYLLLDAWAFSEARGSMIFSSREAAPREELYTYMAAMSKELVGAILGREWTQLAFAPDPPQSSLYVDGVLVASGASPVLYLTPGDRQVRIAALGYHDVVRTLTLAPGQETRLAETLEKEPAGNVDITSVPPGADLYLDSVWKGKTPLVLEKPVARSRGFLALPGFYDLPFSLGVDAPARLDLTLQKDIGARDAAQKAARDDFYAAFGWFAVSVPLPVFSYAFSLDYAERYVQVQGQGSEGASAQLASNLLYGGYWAGIAVSAALFTWMVTRIIHYVQVSNGTGG